jgi:membrane protein involved in colicin uptake
MDSTPPEDSLKPSARALRYGAAIAVVVVGILCGAIIPGTLGGTICTAVVGVGLVAVISLVFYDVGLTEDRDRARTQARDERLRRLEEGRSGTSKPAHREERRRPDRSSRTRRMRDEHGRLG